MRCVSTFGMALPVLGLVSAVAVFAAHSTTTTGSGLAATAGEVASLNDANPKTTLTAANTDLPVAVNMNEWQETVNRRGSNRGRR